jgi:hypothetical protein
MASGPVGKFDSWSNPTAISGTATQAAPTLVTEGIDLDYVEGLRIILSADSGQTLSFTGGSEYIKIWLWSSALSRWCPSKRLYVPLSTADAGDRSFPIEDLPTFVPVGRIFAGPSAVTASGGTNITTTIEVWRR